jgi:predicted lactoylglutathione lyase
VLKPPFSGESSSSLMFSVAIGGMPLTREHYGRFTKRPIDDPCRESHALSAPHRR